MGGITSVLIESAQGALGAIGVDMLMGQIVVRGWIPATMLTQNTYPLVKGATALGVGILANMMPLPAAAKRFVALGVKGSLICTLRDTITPYVSGSFPLGASRYMNYTPGVPRSGYMAGMGYRTSARTMVPGAQRPLLGAAMSTREREHYYPSYGTLGKYMNY